MNTVGSTKLPLVCTLVCGDDMHNTASPSVQRLATCDELVISLLKELQYPLKLLAVVQGPELSGFIKWVTNFQCLHFGLRQ